MATWKALIKALAKDDEIIYCTLTDKELEEEFYSGYGMSNGKPFTAWSEKYVYFPVVYDGAEWVERVPRNICEVATNHVGGE